MTRGTKSKTKKAAQKAAAIARGPKRGLAAFYAEKQARRDTRRATEAARLEAETGCGWAFGARAEAQFLALARLLAEWAELAASAPPKERTPEELAKRRKRALLRTIRNARQSGLRLRILDNFDSVEIISGEIALDPLPDNPGEIARTRTKFAGYWEACKWEPGRIDLEGLGFFPGEGIAIAHVAGDVRRKFGERSREIRWYHARGKDLDPSGAPFSRLAYIGQNLPIRALKDATRILVQKYGNDPIAWPGFKAEAAQYRPDISGDAGPV